MKGPLGLPNDISDDYPNIAILPFFQFDGQFCYLVIIRVSHRGLLNNLRKMCVSCQWLRTPWPGQGPERERRCNYLAELTPHRKLPRLITWRCQRSSSILYTQRLHPLLICKVAGSSSSKVTRFLLSKEQCVAMETKQFHESASTGEGHTLCHSFKQCWKLFPMLLGVSPPLKKKKKRPCRTSQL